MSHLISNLNIKVIVSSFILVIGLSSIASSNSIEDIITKINSIENRIKVLEKATFNQTNSNQSNFSAGNYESIITKQSIQISELQNQIQELTGSIEEVLFSLQTLINNFNNLKADTEMRFSDMNSITSINNDQIEVPKENAAVVDYDLTPKNLGTFEVPLGANDAVTSKQEITATIDQESLILIEDKKPELLILPAGSEVEQYNFSINLLTSGDYEGAEGALKEFIKISKNEELLSNSYFWLAETYYVRENFKDAAKNYLSLYQNHSDSPKAPSGLLKLGIALVKMGQLEQGCASLAKLRIRYPETEQSILNRGDIEIQRNGCKVS